MWIKQQNVVVECVVYANGVVDPCFVNDETVRVADYNQLPDAHLQSEA